MISSQDVDLLYPAVIRIVIAVLGRPSSDVDDLPIAHPSVGGVVTRVNRGLEAIADRFQRFRRLAGYSAFNLYVKKDVNVIGRPHDPHTRMHGVQLDHESADKRPLVGG